MRWLVTGGAGYVGGHVARALRNAGHTVAVLDDLSASDGSRVPTRVPLLRASVTDADGVRRALAAFRADGVAHLAARKNAAESVRDPGTYHRVNVDGTRAVAEAMATLGVGRMIFASSAAVYGDPPPGPVDEDIPTKPANPYGESKVEGEDVLREAARRDGLRAVVLRLFNVAGAGAPELADRGAAALLPGLLRPGCRPRVFGTDYLTPDGSCVRDYVHVLDVTSAFLAAASYLDGDGHESGVSVFNVGSGLGHSVLEVVDVVRRIIGQPLEVELSDRRPGDPAEVVSDISRIRVALDWRPQWTLEDMVRSQWAASRLLRLARARLRADGAGTCVSVGLSGRAQRAHHQRVVAPTVPVQRVPQASFEDEAALLVAADGPGVEAEDVELHPVQPNGGERVVQHQSRRLGTQAAPDLVGYQSYPVAGRLVVRLDVVERRVADEPAVGAVLDRPVQPVGLLRPAGAPLLDLPASELAVRAGEPAGLRVLHRGVQGLGVLGSQRDQRHQLAGENGFAHDRVDMDHRAV